MQSNLQSNYRCSAAPGKLTMHAAALPTGHEGKQTRWQLYTHCTTHVCTRTHTHTQFAIYWSVVLRRVADCSSAVAGWLRSSWCWGCCERFCSWTQVMPTWTRLASDHIFGQFHFHVQFVSIMCMEHLSMWCVCVTSDECDCCCDCEQADFMTFAVELFCLNGCFMTSFAMLSNGSVRWPCFCLTSRDLILVSWVSSPLDVCIVVTPICSPGPQEHRYALCWHLFAHQVHRNINMLCAGTCLLIKSTGI